MFAQNRLFFEDLFTYLFLFTKKFLFIGSYFMLFSCCFFFLLDERFLAQPFPTRPPLNN